MSTTAEAQEFAWCPPQETIEEARMVREARDAAIGGHRPRFNVADERASRDRWVGEVLEFFVCDLADRFGLQYDYLGGKGEPDFRFGRITVDCKAGSGRGRPRSDYRVEISADERLSPVAAHLFGHWTPEEGRIYVLGAVSHERLLSEGTPYAYGEQVGPFRVKDRKGIISMPVSGLLGPREFFAHLERKQR